MHQFQTAAILTALAICLPGCAPLVLAIWGIEMAAAPGPLTTIEVISESEPGACGMLIGGDPRNAYLREETTRYHSAASTRSPIETRVADWKEESSDGSFVVLAGTQEPRPAGSSFIGRPFDAARGYFDINGDGLADLVYEIAGPPRLNLAYVVIPADDQIRLWFENRLGQLSQNWRAELTARGGRVIELSRRDYDRLSTANHPTNYSALPRFAVLRHGGQSFVVIQERDIPFDPMRSTPPLSLGDAETDAHAAKAATVASIYSLGTDFALTKRCEILGQWISLLFGGF